MSNTERLEGLTKGNFALTRYTSSGETQLIGAFEHIVRLGREGPVESLNASLAAEQEIIEGDKISREGVMVRGDFFGEECQPWIAIAHLKITQELIIASVLLHDIDHVFDVLPQKGKQAFISFGLGWLIETVVTGDLLGKPRQFDGIGRRHG